LHAQPQTRMTDRYSGERWIISMKASQTLKPSDY
jgi:hypothetical protein